jgi:hypothetical protein
MVEEIADTFSTKLEGSAGILLLKTAYTAFVGRELTRENLTGWQVVPIQDLLTEIVVRVSNSVFVGYPLCTNAYLCIW